MNLLFDFGNTQTKMAVYDRKKLLKVQSFANISIEIIQKFTKNAGIKKSIVCSVTDVPNNITAYLKEHTQLVILNHSQKLPFINSYKTPETLGKDRIAAVAGAVTLFPKKNILIADFGTAITYEVLKSNGEYLGGNISPGLDTRFRALHEFTKKLPLIKRSASNPLIGQNTSDAILAGVQQGIIFEIESYISVLSTKMKPLTVVFTGGDSIFFEKMVKYPIFAEPNLVLTGLNRILEENA
jgi:type III pantothenate kinase